MNESHRYLCTYAVLSSHLLTDKNQAFVLSILAKFSNFTYIYYKPLRVAFTLDLYAFNLAVLLASKRFFVERKKKRKLERGKKFL